MLTVSFVVVAAWAGLLWHIGRTPKGAIEMQLLVVWGLLSLSLLLALGRWALTIL